MYYEMWAKIYIKTEHRLQNRETKLRVLCMGIGSSQSTKWAYYNLNEASYPTIFDYDLVIIDLVQLQSSYYQSLAKTKSEFEKFFQNRGVCFVFMSRYQEINSVSNLDWCPFSGQIRITNKLGETMACTNNRVKFIFDFIKFKWSYFFSEWPENATILATNRTNDPISILVPYGTGYCVFLPYLPSIVSATQADQLLNLLIEKGMNIIPEKEEKVSSSDIPSWATSLMTKTELDLFKTKNEIDKKLGKYNKFKPLYWETGNNLQDLVINAFEELGVEVTRLPRESHGDFEISISKDLIGVCEVKGLLGSANREDLRQLLDYFIEQRNVKGIFIVNHFRNEELDKRGKPATTDALDLIKKYNFHLLTTIQLYEVLTKFWENKLTKTDFLMRFQEESTS
jgi:hypothetical protein